MTPEERAEELASRLWDRIWLDSEFDYRAAVEMIAAEIRRAVEDAKQDAR